MKYLSLALIMTLSVIACKTSNTEKYLEKAQSNTPYDAIIVPGVPYDGKSWSDVMSIRVRWSNYLYKRGVTKNIIYSGGAVYTPYMECKVMAEYGKAMGIPANNIYLDSLAEHSTENVFYSYILAQKLGFKRIALATDAYQTFMIRRFMRKLRKRANANIDIIPIVIDTMKTLDKSEPQINPELAYKKSFISIEESQSKLHRYKGTLGQNVDWSLVGYKN